MTNTPTSPLPPTSSPLTPPHSFTEEPLGFPWAWCLKENPPSEAWPRIDIDCFIIICSAGVTQQDSDSWIKAENCCRRWWFLMLLWYLRITIMSMNAFHVCHVSLQTSCITDIRCGEKNSTGECLQSRGRFFSDIPKYLPLNKFLESLNLVVVVVGGPASFTGDIMLPMFPLVSPQLTFERAVLHVDSHWISGGAAVVPVPSGVTNALFSSLL